MTDKNYDPENFTFDLASHSDSLLSVFAAPDVNSKVGIINNAFRQVLDAHAPVKTVKQPPMPICHRRDQGSYENKKPSPSSFSLNAQ